MAKAITRFNPPPALLLGESGRPFIGPLFGRCFNPPPASLLGESSMMLEVGFAVVVSIRPQHRCWGNRSGLTAQARARWFQSAPSIAAGGIDGAVRVLCVPELVSIRPQHRCWGNHIEKRLCPARKKFQSAPSIAAGGIQPQLD